MDVYMQFFLVVRPLNIRVTVVKIQNCISQISRTTSLEFVSIAYKLVK